MARFSEQKINLSSINGGVKYENGDVVFAEAINAPIEASAYAQKVADEAKSKAEQALSYTGQTYSPLSAYPIGSIYISTNNISPAESVKNGGLGGGTWERIQDCFLLGASSTYSLGSTGGSADAVVVSHKHTVLAYDDSNFVSISSGAGTAYGRKITTTAENTFADTMSAGRLTTSDAKSVYYGSNTSIGVDGKDKNMPPYLAVYMWKRTA